jgi:hypothetical protein
MLISNILNIFNHISESIGWPPLVLFCTIGIFFFIFIFGLVILVKVKSIRKDLTAINRNLASLNQRLHDEMKGLKAVKPQRYVDDKNLEFEYQRPNENESAKESSHGFSSGIEDQSGHYGKISSDSRTEELLGARPHMSDIKSKVLRLLRATRRPVSYYDIAKHLSKESPDYNFETILKELDQLKKDGEVIGQVSAGKLYFQIKN